MLLVVFATTLLATGGATSLAMHATYTALANGLVAVVPGLLDAEAIAIARRGETEPDRLRAGPLGTLAGAGGSLRLEPARHPDARLGDPRAIEPEVRHAPDGRFVVRLARAVPGSELDLVWERPFSEVYAPLYAVAGRAFLLDLLIVLAACSFAYRSTATIVRPIEALSESARRLAGGDVEARVEEPSSNDEVALLARTFNDMARRLATHRDELHTAQRSLEERFGELARANEVLEQLSITDGLTKLHNHRYFQDFLTREIKRAGRSREPLAMLLIDIDDFKRLNDRHGHAAGDELLKGVSRLLNAGVRESDLLARYGGEEFVVLAPNTDADGMTWLAEKLRMEIAEASFLIDDSMQLVKLTVSIGAALYGGNRKTFFTVADQALYRAKAGGKNCVEIAES